MVLGNPIAWGDIYAAIYAWVYGATALTTIWADQDEARPDYPYVLLDVKNMGRTGGLEEVRHEVDLTRARDIKVTPVAQNATSYSVTINGTLFTYVSDASATVAEITAGLKTAIDAGSEPVTTTDNSTDLDIEGDAEVLNPTLKQLFTVVVTDDFDGDQISWANNDEGNEIAQTAVGRRDFILNVQAFDRNEDDDLRGSDPDRNAFDQLSILQASLGLPSVQAQLRAVNVAIREEMDILDLSATVEDAIESRATMDIRMSTTSELTEYIGYITTVEGEGTLTAGTETITETFQAES